VMNSGPGEARPDRPKAARVKGPGHRGISAAGQRPTVMLRIIARTGTWPELRAAADCVPGALYSVIQHTFDQPARRQSGNEARVPQPVQADSVRLRALAPTASKRQAAAGKSRRRALGRDCQLGGIRRLFTLGRWTADA